MFIIFVPCLLSIISHTFKEARTSSLLGLLLEPKMKNVIDMHRHKVLHLFDTTKQYNCQARVQRPKVQSQSQKNLGWPHFGLDHSKYFFSFWLVRQSPNLSCHSCKIIQVDYGLYYLSKLTLPFYWSAPSVPGIMEIS